MAIKYIIMKKIFILENSRIVSELLKNNLIKEFNCSVTIFENGDELIDNIMSNPSVIILNHFIDDEFDGNALIILKKIKDLNKLMPVIVYSGQHNFQLAKEFLKIGAESYIDKIEESFLENIINAVDDTFKHENPNYQRFSLNKIIGIYKNQVFGLGIFVLFLVFSLLSV